MVKEFVHGTVKRSPGRCQVMSNDKISLCGCISPHLVLTCLGCTCHRPSIFRAFCSYLPMTKISNALRKEVHAKGTFHGMETGAKAIAKVDSLTNCLASIGKRGVSFIVVGRGMLGTHRTHGLRSGVYRLLVRLG